MYIKGNDSFPHCSVLQHVIAPDSDSVWHLLLKSYISKSRGLCKVFSQMILSQAVVKNLIMSATSHECHTHLWESPNILNQELLHGEYEIKSLEAWRGLFPPLCSSQDTVTAPVRLTFLLSQLRICALLAIEIHAYSWAGVVLGSRKAFVQEQTLFHCFLYQKNKSKNHWLVVCTSHSPWNICVSDSYQGGFGHTGD